MRSPNKAQQKLFADILLLEKEKAESEALFLSIGEGAVSTDGSGNISRINTIALDILGYQSEDIMGRWYPDTIVAEDETGKVIPHMERPITKAFLTGEPVAARLFYRKKDGSRVAVSLNVSPILLNGVPLGAIEVFRDISPEVKLERTKDEFISLASHQLRTPATGVKQYLGMVLQGFAGDITSTQREMLAKAYESNERQLRIITDLLRVANVDAGKVALNRTKTDISTLVEDVVREQSAIFEQRNQNIVFRKTDTPVLAYIDQNAIRMVIENIVDNAGKYSPENTRVTVKIEESVDEVRIKVKDQGVGIRSGDKERVFEKFSRLDNSLSVRAGGTGIGLYWAKKIVDFHRGTITYKSIVNKGTEFSVVLPKELDLKDFSE